MFVPMYTFPGNVRALNLQLACISHVLQGDVQAQLSNLRDEGNKHFGAKDYAKALESYDKALKLIPATHQDKPLLHSNKAACHMMAKKYAHVAAAFTHSPHCPCCPVFGLLLATMLLHFRPVGSRKPPTNAQLLLKWRLGTTKL